VTVTLEEKALNTLY